MLILLAIVVGIGGGASIAALAGAQRTDTAVPEFLSYALADDGGFLFGNVSSPPNSPGPADSLALAPAERKIVDLPQVAAYFRAPYLFLTPDRTGSNAARDADQINVIGDADRDLYRSVDRPLVVSGRLPDPHRPFEVAVNELAATGHHLHVGSTLRLYAYSYAQVSSGELTASSSATPIRPTGPSYLVHVTGVVRFPQDVNAVLPLVDSRACHTRASATSTPPPPSSSGWRAAWEFPSRRCRTSISSACGCTTERPTGRHSTGRSPGHPRRRSPLGPPATCTGCARLRRAPSAASVST